MQTAACTSIVSLENNSEQSGHSTKADGESSVYSSNTGAASGKTKKNIEKYHIEIKKKIQIQIFFSCYLSVIDLNAKFYWNWSNTLCLYKKDPKGKDWIL